MYKKLKQFAYPKTIAEATGLMNKQGNVSQVLAGGVALSRASNPDVEVMVDISRLGLTYIKEEGKSICIGATTSLQDIANSPALQSHAGGLISKVAGGVSTHLVRNVGTLGGNLMQANPHNGMPLALLTLDASVVMVIKKNERIIPFHKLAKELPQGVSREKGLIKEIRFPKTHASWGSSYMRFSRTCSEWEGIVKVAVSCEIKDGKCFSARIAVGSATRRSTRFVEAEKILEGKSFSASQAQKAGEFVAGSMDLLPSTENSDDYRRKVTQALVARALCEAGGC